MFNFFKGEDEPKTGRKKFNSRRGKPNPRRSSNQSRNKNSSYKGNKKFNSNDKNQKNVRKPIAKAKKPVRTSAPKKPLKPKSGNVKVAPEATPKPVDDNIGNRIEPVKKKPVRRAKNDPRS